MGAFHPAPAASVVLEKIEASHLPGNRVRLELDFSAPPPKPTSFTIDNPARIALDLPGTRNGMKQRSVPVRLGAVRSVSAAETKDRTRVVINLDALMGYEMRVQGNKLFVTIGNGGATGVQPVKLETPQLGPAAPTPAAAPSVRDIDFRRGPNGEGRVVITLSSTSMPVNLETQGGKIILDLPGATLPPALQRRMDVIDFATPVQYVEAYREPHGTRIVIVPNPKIEWEHLAYQTDNVFTVEVQQVPKAEREARRRKEFKGERLSLNFQDIDVRAVLQLIADFTNLNLVVSDSVSGRLTLRLKNVPWDQALDIILKTKGLAMRKQGNVLLVAPAQELAAREKLELEAQKQVEELAPLRTEFIQVNYARAQDLAALLKSPENSLMSSRGRVSIDARTNTLLVQDTAEKLEQIRQLVKRLDVPVRQVLIESRIVTAEDKFSRELGVRFGFTESGGGIVGDSTNTALSGSLAGTRSAIAGVVPGDEGLNVNLPIANPAGSIGLALAKLPLGYMLELELAAAQAEDRIEVISTPRVITSNQTQARIERGTEIPYQQATSSGATAVQFKKAVLSLEVTPTITPDDRIFMDIEVSKDDVGDVFNGVPSVNTRAIQTQVLVQNGQTVVLGGIYDTEKVNSTDSVPYLGEVPLLGRLFRRDLNKLNKSELLIFITPRLIDETLSLKP
ncbi:MAG TPA: type IV pilus secretin PilQ [Chromatiales bacterium]|nr:type IV pilus secretin PilQ [Chromatiales bacterium]